VTAWVNDMTAAMVAKYPAQLDFMAYVNPFEEGSIHECERCLTTLGAKGVSIVSSVNGAFLDSAQLNPFWEYAQAKEAAVFIHPPMLPIGYQQMNRYKLEEVVGRPFDTTMNIARMIYSGVFDRYPRLQVVLAHMGGGLPSVLGRLDFGYRLGYEGLPQKEHIDIVRGLGLHPVDQAKILWKNADDLFKLGLTEQVRGAAAREG
jgi:aminocarboxymuconate-semialdehyde decarboxylase